MINWKPIEEFPGEYISTQKQVLIKTYVGIVSAWVDEEDFEWVCYDDMFFLDFDDATITHFAEIE